LESPCRVLVKWNWSSFSISYGWGARRQNMSKLTAFRRGQVTWRQDFRGEAVVPLSMYWYHSKGNWLRYNFAADSFYIMKLCSRLFVLYCQSCPKDNKSRYFDPHFEEIRGGVDPCLIARWKACVEFLLSVIELLFVSLMVEALQGKTCQDSLLSEEGTSLGAKISGGRGRLWGIFFGFYKSRNI